MTSRSQIPTSQGPSPQAPARPWRRLGGLAAAVVILAVGAGVCVFLWRRVVRTRLRERAGSNR